MIWAALLCAAIAFALGFAYVFAKDYRFWVVRASMVLAVVLFCSAGQAIGQQRFIEAVIASTLLSSYALMLGLQVARRVAGVTAFLAYPEDVSKDKTVDKTAMGEEIGPE